MRRRIWRPHFGLRVWLAVVAGLACLFGGALLAPGSTHAGSCGAEGYGWFSGKDFSCEIYGAGGSDVDPGHFGGYAQNDFSGSGACNVGMSTCKSDFISKVEGSSARRFYVSLINGSSTNTSNTDFEQRVNSSDIGIRIMSRSTALNSAYLPDQNDYVFYTTGSPTDVPSLVLYNVNTGTTYTEIKIDCGNPLNRTPLPNDTDPVGQFVSVTCNANGTYDVVVRFHDDDATSQYPTRARLTAQDGTTQINGSQSGKDADGSTLGNDPVEWSAPSIADNQWPIQLQVRDVDKDGAYHGYQEVATHGQPQCNGNPNGHITASCTTSGVSWSGWFYDPDGATTAAESGAGAGAHSYSSGASNISQATAKNFSGSNTSVHPSGMITLKLVVADKGGSNDYTTTDSATCPAPSGDCPGDPVINANTLVTLQTPYNTPHGTASWAGKTTATKNNVQYQDTAISNSNFAIADISIGGAREVPSITSYGTNNQTVTVNYQKFVDTYPYDSNQAEATYKTNYKETTWKADTFDHWACDGGGTYNGNGTEATGGGSGKCGTHPVNEGLLCPTAAFSHSDGTCYFLASQYPTQAKCTAHSGYNWLHSECLHVVSGYRCPSGEYASGDNPTYCYKNVNYPAPTEYWAYTNQGTTSGLSQNNTSTGNYKMNACFARNFNVVSISVTASKNSNENPSGGSAAATADVKFSAPQGIGVRVPYSITSGLSFTARMQGQLLTCSNSASGPFTVTSGSTATTAEVPTAPVPGISCTIAQPAPLGGQVCANYTVSPTGDKVSDTGVVVTSDGGSVSGLACSTPVVNEPYLKVFGGDVAAGTGFLNGNNVSCSNNSSASIQTFNTGVNPYGGSGTALAALSVKRIATNVTDEGFASAQGGGVSGSTVPAPKTLSFGNDDSVSRYGGDYGASSSGCSPDYSSGAPTQTASNGLAGAVNLSGLNGTYVATDTLQLSGTITQGHHVLIYSSWPVTISGPIAFSNPGTTIADMPSFSLVVKNNDININGNVSSLAGNYIAQGGTINDCVTNGNIYTYCSTKLTVYGSFVANNIEFYRMGQNGSLRYSAADSGPGSNNASEEFDYSPATWLAQPPASGTPPAYDAVTSLPPVL